MNQTILVVEDNEITREVLARRLEEQGYGVIAAVDGRSALDVLDGRQVDLVLLDLLMDGLDGLEVLELLRRRHAATALPVIVLTVKEGSDDVIRALRLGANDYVTKSIDFSVILARVRTQLSLRRLMHQVERMAVLDPLTETYNRRGFYGLAEKEEARSRRYGSSLQCLMIDIDRFKEVNDTFGHQIGDRVIRQVAGRCRQELRSCDLIGRWGGEEFAVLLPGIDLEGARNTAERLRAAVEDSPVETTSGPIRVTLSIGVASFDASCKSLEELLGRVDRAMYEAKRTGRNQVRVLAD